jgi:hypothetical protein
MSHQHHRRRMFIDRPIQSALLFRAAAYWGVSLMTQLLFVFFFAVVSSSPDSFYAKSNHLWWHLELSVIGAMLLLPMILLDILRLSHRWVGPIFRLRSSLQALSRGACVPPIRFREGDFWQELAGDFNVVAAELAQRRGTSPTEVGLDPSLAAGHSDPAPDQVNDR